MSLQCPLIFLSASFLISSYPLLMEVLPQYTGCSWKETGFSGSIPYSWSSQALTHCSPFPLQESLPLAISALHSPWDRGSTGKVLFLSIVSLSIYNLLQQTVLEYLTGKLNFYKVSLIHGCLPKLTRFRFFPTMTERSWGQFTQFCWLHSQYRDLSVYFLMHW